VVLILILEKNGVVTIVIMIMKMLVMIRAVLIVNGLMPHLKKKLIVEKVRVPLEKEDKKIGINLHKEFRLVKSEIDLLNKKLIIY